MIRPPGVPVLRVIPCHLQPPFLGFVTALSMKGQNAHNNNDTNIDADRVHLDPVLNMTVVTRLKRNKETGQETARTIHVSSFNCVKSMNQTDLDNHSASSGATPTSPKV